MCMSSQYAWGRVVLTSPLHRQQDEVGGHRGVHPRLQKNPWQKLSSHCNPAPVSQTTDFLPNPLLLTPNPLQGAREDCTDASAAFWRPPRDTCLGAP